MRECVTWMGIVSLFVVPAAWADTPFPAQARGKYALGQQMCRANPERCITAQQRNDLKEYARTLWQAWGGEPVRPNADPRSACTRESICSADHPPVFFLTNRTSSPGVPNASAMISQEADGTCVKVVMISSTAYPLLFPNGRFDPVAAATLLPHEVGHHIHAACAPRYNQAVSYDETFADLCGAEIAARMQMPLPDFARASCTKFAEQPGNTGVPEFPVADLLAGRCSQRLRETAAAGEAHGSGGCRHRRYMSELGRLGEVESRGRGCQNITRAQVIEECAECVAGATSTERRNFCSR